MKKNDLISVIIPAYNHACFIRETILSFVEQTYNNIELIVIDDGSSDKTPEIIEGLKAEYSGRFKDFIFIKKKNEGVTRTLNRGLQIAQGSYIALCASDDYHLPHSLEIQHKFLSENPSYGITVPDNIIIDDNSKICFWDKHKNNVHAHEQSTYKTFGEYLKSSRHDIDFSSAEFGSYKSLVSGNYIPNGYLIRADILIKKIQGYSETITPEDYYLMLQLSKLTRFKFIETPLFAYRWHDNNTIKNKNAVRKFRNAHKELIKHEKPYALLHGVENELYRIQKRKILHFIEIEKSSTEHGRLKTVKIFDKIIYKKLRE